MVSLIACIDTENGIGKEGTIPWALSPDMKRFKELTQGTVVIMGRRTWESIGSKPLPKRVNLIVSSTMRHAHRATVVKTVKQAIDLANTIAEKVFVIGGERIYRDAIPYASKIYLTKILNKYECDTFFPPIDKRQYSVNVSDVMTHQGIQYVYATYLKRAA